MRPDARTVAVIGASLAGLSAARALRAQGYDGRLVLVGEEDHPPYDRPPLSKAFLLGGASEADLALTAPEDADLGLEWQLGRRAEHLDAAAGLVRLAGGEELRADGIVLATGARARRLLGTDGLDGVHVLRSLEDARALREALPAAAHVVIVGAGFIGAEVASAARALRREVTVVEALPVPLAGVLGPEMGAACARLHGDHGVRLLTGTGVARLRGRQRVDAVELLDGRVLPADLVVVGIGAAPAVEWLAGSGLRISGGVLTGADGATGIPGVVAVGDCATPYDPVLGTHVRVEHWTHALEQPAAAAAVLLGRTPPPPALPYFWSDQYGHTIQYAGRHAAGDTVRVVEGDPGQHSFLAVYEREGRPVAALGMDQPRLFTGLRRQLRGAHLAASQASQARRRPAQSVLPT